MSNGFLRVAAQACLRSTGATPGPPKGREEGVCFVVGVGEGRRGGEGGRGRKEEPLTVLTKKGVRGNPPSPSPLGGAAE